MGRSPRGGRRKLLVQRVVLVDSKRTSVRRASLRLQCEICRATQCVAASSLGACLRATAGVVTTTTTTRMRIWHRLQEHPREDPRRRRLPPLDCNAHPHPRRLFIIMKTPCRLAAGDSRPRHTLPMHRLSAAQDRLHTARLLNLSARRTATTPMPGRNNLCHATAQRLQEAVLHLLEFHLR